MKWLVSIVLLLVLGSCNNGQTNQKSSDAEKAERRLDKVKWILGKWSVAGPEGTFYEYWQQESRTLFAGTGLLISASGDTIFTENLKLADSAGALWYIPRVSDQNNAAEVPFRETKNSATEIVFENLAHDFPQRIIYRKTAPDSIYARVEGMQNGRMRSEDFRMAKE